MLVALLQVDYCRFLPTVSYVRASPWINTNSYGVNKYLQLYSLLPILAMAGAGQVGAAIAIYVKTKNKRIKNVIKGGFPTGFLE